MIKLLIIFILPLSLYASKILSYNIYDRTDRVDVMITFDTPYDGVIKQSIGQSKISIKLQDAEIESAKLKNISSKYLKSISITPMSEYTKIVAKVPKSVRLRASKTADAYGLRLRFSTEAVKSKSSSIKKNAPGLVNLPTKREDDISQSYYIVIAILTIGILILFYIKKRVSNPVQSGQQPNSPWLFKENKQKTDINKQESYTDKHTPQPTNDVSIRFQKSIDAQNSVVMLDFVDQSYLVLMGKSNILLDRFVENKPQSQDEFETILQSRHKELDDFLNSDRTKDEYKEPKEALQAYKERAAAIVYDS